MWGNAACAFVHTGLGQVVSENVSRLFCKGDASDESVAARNSFEGEYTVAELFIS